MLSPTEQGIVDQFHALYYHGPQGRGMLFEDMSWMGVSCLKCPTDLWIYQELLFELRPDFIVETGTFAGGSALYLAHLCDLLGHGHIITIDIEPRPRPSHPRITYLTGSSVAPEIVTDVKHRVQASATTLVILDSDHSEAHVALELEHFSPLVTPGSYLIVEDSNVNGHPVDPFFGPGPYEAVQKFLDSQHDFERDASREKFLLTFNPHGFLRRRGGAGDRGVVPPVTETSTPVAHDSIDSAILRASLKERNQRIDELRADVAEVGAGFKQALDQLKQRDEQLARTEQELIAARQELFRLRGNWITRWFVRT